MAKCLDDIRGELDVLVDVIPKTVPTEKIILFGSFVNGTPHEDSDIDVYVVLNDNSDIHPIDAIHLMNRALRGHVNMPMDLLAGHKAVYDARRILPTLERAINREGVILYE